MNTRDFSRLHVPAECQPLMDACTPTVYRHNAFRITGLLSDANTRDIKRRIEELKHAEELGDAEDEHLHAFALSPPPSLSTIREAAQRLQDSESRIVQEFFWFWPFVWGEGKKDKALQLLVRDEKEAAFNLWKDGLASKDKRIASACKHNLAVMYQMLALDGENLLLRRGLNQEALDRIERYWRRSFTWWEELTDDEHFWSAITDRIRQINDPRLTTGFARRMRATFPEAMDRINGELALDFIEAGKVEFAHKQIIYMKETHPGLDDVPKTLAMVTASLRSRVQKSVETARDQLRVRPENAWSIAEEFFDSVDEPIATLKEMLPPDDYQLIDLGDSITEVARSAHIVLVEESDDWDSAQKVLKRGIAYAVSEEVRKQAVKALEQAKVAPLVSIVMDCCKESVELATTSPKVALRKMESLLESSSLKVSPFKQLLASEASEEIKDVLRNTVAVALGNCAIAYANDTHDMEKCTSVLRCALEYARDPVLRKYLQDNLRAAEANMGLQTQISRVRHPSPSGSYSALPYQQQGGSSGQGLGCLAVIGFVVLMAMCSASGAPQSSAERSSQPVPTVQIELSPPIRTDARAIGLKAPALAELAREIDAEKESASNMEKQLRQMDGELRRLEIRMNEHERQNRIQDYNRNVPLFNGLLVRRNAIHREYRHLTAAINQKVSRYNAAIR